MPSVSNASALALTHVALYDSAEFQKNFTYTGNDLGVCCTDEHTEFRLWAPTAVSVTLKLYPDGGSSAASETISMTKQTAGVWFTAVSKSLHGTYYTYELNIDDTLREAPDPYAKACGANGVRSMVVDLTKTNPDNWADDHGPALASPTDAILYELHVRDLSSDASSNIQAKGKFLGLTETGMSNAAGMSTGLDHILELGATHVHLLPSFDYSSVDETAEAPDFNWGYDPANYNVPEGSYSTNAADGTVRITEFKKAIQAMHSHGLGVIMDVVYNHTAATDDSCFNRVVPHYYYRICPDGTFSNGSACGNETASDRSMVQKYIVDSIVYWAKEYHIDGFRFDLMGLHDIATMQAVRKALDEISPKLLLYGEGWTGGPSTLPEEQRTLKKHVSQIPGLAVFNDNIRDSLKGSVFEEKEKGFVSGKKRLSDAVRLCICGCTVHPEIPSRLLNDPETCWAGAPSQSINYVSAHDNLTLWDKLAISAHASSRRRRVLMNQLAAAIYLTSQGIPFFQAGEEFLRSKPMADGKGFNENSYNAPDCTNSLKWDELTKNRSTFEYYKGLIAFRKAHPALRLATTEAVAAHLSFFKNVPDNTIAYHLTGTIAGEALREIVVLINPNPEELLFSIPRGNWDVYAAGSIASAHPIGHFSGDSLSVAGITCTILGR